MAEHIMKLNEQYCKAREEYCSMVSKVIDRLEEIISKPLASDFVEGVIKSAGVPEPYTPDNFDDIIGETVGEYIQKLLSTERIAGYREEVSSAQARAPTANEVTFGSGNATWKDMQNIIHKGLESDVVAYTLKYLPDSDPIKEECLIAQANYHRVYSLVENADSQSLNSEVAAEVRQEHLQQQASEESPSSTQRS
jgi:hypothetical protein